MTSFGEFVACFGR